MKILVFSDSHGNVSNMAAAVERQHPDLVVHLGDCWQDADRLRLIFPNLPIEQVNGNCDPFPQGVWERCVSLGGKTALLCHGHTYGVKSGYDPAIEAALARGVDFLLFGHTHRPELLRLKSLTVMNPGSVGQPMFGSYGVITVDETGVADCHIQPNEREE